MSESTPNESEIAVAVRLAQIEGNLAALQQRNARVEVDKAWETSFVRRGIVALITYFVAVVLLLIIGNELFYLGALVPTAGYLLSTLTLLRAKKRWARGRI